MKKVQQINTMFPIGFKLLINVITTSFTPGARLITRNGRNALSNRKTRITPKIFGESKKMNGRAMCKSRCYSKQVCIKRTYLYERTIQK